MNIIATSYGTALFELACEQKIEDSVYDSVTLLQKALQDNSAIIQWLATPFLLTIEQKKIIDEWSLNCSLLENTIHLMCKKHHGNELLGCLDSFIKQYHELKGILCTQVISAIELNRNAKNMLKKTLESITQQQLLLNYTIDPDCIGGLKITIDNRVFDASIQGNLDQLRSILTKNNLYDNG